MRELSLFSGGGGGLLAGHLLGWDTRGYVEWDPYCQQLLAARIRDGLLPVAPIFGDIRAFVGEGYAAAYQGLVDVVSGGFPCQPFSIAGKQGGADDARNMWPATLDVLRAVRPRYAFLENVPGLLTSGYFGTVLRGLAEERFSVAWCVLGAGDVGAPHRRKRLWLLAVAEPGSHRCGGGDGEPLGERGSSEASLFGAQAGEGVAEPPRYGLEGRAERERSQARAHASRGGEVADTHGAGLEERAHLGGDVRAGLPAALRDGRGPDEVAEPSGLGRGKGRAEPARQQGGPPRRRAAGPHVAHAARLGGQDGEVGPDGGALGGPVPGAGGGAGRGYPPAGVRILGGAVPGGESPAPGRISWWDRDPADRVHAAGCPGGTVVADFEPCSCGAVEPLMGRVVDGMAGRVDRLRALGNGQVPAVAATAWRLLGRALAVNSG